MNCATFIFIRKLGNSYRELETDEIMSNMSWRPVHISECIKYMHFLGIYSRIFNLQAWKAQNEANMDPSLPFDSSKHASHDLLTDQLNNWAKTEKFNHAMMAAHLLDVMQSIGFFMIE